MSHERYPLEARLRVPFSHTIPSEPRPTGIGDDADGLKDQPFLHRTPTGEALIVPGINCIPDEVAQLAERGAVFPLEVAEPQLATFYDGNGNVMFPRPIQRDDI